jgi:hypothetical protein
MPMMRSKPVGYSNVIVLEYPWRDRYILAKCLVIAKKSLESFPERFQEGSDIDDIQELMKHPAFVGFVPTFEETYPRTLPKDSIAAVANPVWKTR